MSVSASPAGTPPEGDAPGLRLVPSPARRAAVTRSRVTAGLAGLVLLVTLLFPNELGDLTPPAFARIPLEGLLGAVLLLLLPARPGRVLATLAGVGLAASTVLSVLDLGFYQALDRPFDPVFDAVLVRDGVEFLRSSLGRTGAVGVVAGVLALTATLLVATTAAALRARRLLAEHDARATLAVGVLAVAWVTCYWAGAQLTSGVPVASKSAAALAVARAGQVRDDLRDRAEFGQVAAVDRFRDTPADRLLTGLRGKDVVLAFVESYGRSAVEDPELSRVVGPALDDASARLAAAGWGSRSGWLVSPTAGGGSWLAHSTTQSGLWVKTQQRYRSLVTSDRFTLTRAFSRAGWRTVGFMPGVVRAWPEGAFYGYDRLYTARDLGYRGPRFSWATMPDQYSLAALQRTELGRPGHPPTMVEVPLLSSHAPWAPLPRMVDWDALGDGSVFRAQAAGGTQPRDVWPDAGRVRTAYATSVAYSLTALTQWLERSGTRDTVVVFLGDHQPAPVVVGSHATHDVPVTIVAKDPAVLAQVAGWQWTPGLRPAANAPVWPMWSFRDRFLASFGSKPTR